VRRAHDPVRRTEENARLHDAEERNYECERDASSDGDGTSPGSRGEDDERQECQVERHSDEHVHRARLHLALFPTALGCMTSCCGPNGQAR
jgi:hypothetical protein